MIRQLVPADGPLLKRLRLAALGDAPDQFAETAAQAVARTDEQWQALAASTHLAERAGEAVGIVFDFPDSSDPTTGRLGGIWVAPSARRSGIGLALVNAVRVSALASGRDRIRLWVEPATPAEQLYLRAAFAPTGKRKPFPGHDSRLLSELQLDLHRAD